MSPLLLSLPSMIMKPAFRNPSVRCFSSSSELISPFVVLDARPCGSGVGKLVIVNGFVVTVLEKKAPLGLVEAKRIIGASHGWVATLKDGVVRLQDDLILSASDTNLKRISLPPLVTLPHSRTQMVTNMAMSSSSPEDKDCIVAFKFLGPQLSLCSPAQNNSEWVNIEIKDPSFFFSPVIYSKISEMFCIPASGGHVIGSWDLNKNMYKPKLQSVRFRKVPELIKVKREFLNSCCMSEHLVESRPGGETFMVKWYRKKNTHLAKMRTKAIMVFKLDEQGNAVYTKDIGDLCIFLSKSESFCVTASYFPLLFPNKVYIQAYDEHGFVDIGMPLDVSMVDSGHTPNLVPYYIPPQNIEYK